MDLERLSQSIDDQNVQSTFNQVNEWIDVHGATLLRTNQRLPFSYSEAEEIRKQHEKVELKCMKFLAFYAKINLKSLPVETEETREKMDIAIQHFSEQIKGRRHVVISFYTFYRHLQKLQGDLSDVQNEDLSNLPETLDEINNLIGRFTQKINKCLKSFAHLRDESDRVKSSMYALMTLPNNYIDRQQCEDARDQIDSLLQDTETFVTKIFESQQLLQLELKIESKMMVIEDDVARCCVWLEKMTTKLMELYRDRLVGMVTVENDKLQAEVQEVVNKMKLTYDYGLKLMNMYRALCNEFQRDVTRGCSTWDKLSELWKPAKVISSEALKRLSLAGKLFHSLDSILDKLEDTLILMNVSKASTTKMCDQLRKDTSQDLQMVKQWSNELFVKFRYDLANEKIQVTNQVYPLTEQTENMIKMKIFTIVVKLKELDRYILNEDTPVRDKENMVVPDEEFVGYIDKYLQFLRTTKKTWESKRLPVTLAQADKALEEHYELAEHSNQYWRNIDAATQSMKNSESNKTFLADTTREQENWMRKWTAYLEEHLINRQRFLRKVLDFCKEIENDRSKLDDLIGERNDDLDAVKEVKKKLAHMKLDNSRKEQIKVNLHKEGDSIHKGDFLAPLSSMDDCMDCHQDQLEPFLELQDLIEEILEFLPHLYQFRKCCEIPQTSKDKQKADLIKKKIASFDEDRLKKLAVAVYGDSRRVEWLIDELRGNFSKAVGDEHITPVVRLGQEMSTNSKGSKEHDIVSAKIYADTELIFEVDPLSGNSRDQYNVEWFKDHLQIYPRSDSRFSTLFDPDKGRMGLRIEHCKPVDSGKYWCKVYRGSESHSLSSSVILTVSPDKPAQQATATPLFAKKIHAARSKPLTLKLSLSGYRFAPDVGLQRNRVSVNMNGRDSPWSRTLSNTMVEFMHKGITDKDGGLYEVLVAGTVVANVEVVVGDKSSSGDPCIKHKVNIGEPVLVTVPIKAGHQKVVWTKNSKILSPRNTDVKCRLNKAGNPVLEIIRATTKHTGSYMCEVSDESGKTSTQVVIDVVTTEKKCSLGTDAPDGGSGMDKFVANIGESVVLATTYSPANSTNIYWTKDDELLSGSDPRIQISVDQYRRCTLLINDTKVTDCGKYTASIRGTNRRQSTFLEIRPSDSGPVIEKYPDRVGIKANEPLEIECLIRSAAPCCGVKWTFYPENGDGPIDIVGDDRHTLTESIVGDEHMQRVHLSIDPVTDADAGEYVMRYDDHCGYNSVRIPVTVSGTASITKRSPAFLQPLKREVTSSGDGPVVLICKVMGDPPPRVQWTKNGQEVVQSDFIKVTSMDGLHELCIFNPRSNDSGTYQVLAKNSEGLKRCQCLVTVVGPPRSEIEDRTVGKNFTGTETGPQLITKRTQLIFSNTVVSTPPKFESTFSDKVVKEDQEVVLRCQLSGHPEPVVWWSYNTHLLKNPRYDMTRNGNEYSLTIRRVCEQDTGRYSMTAENSSGLATCSALVVVERLDGPQDYVSSLEMPGLNNCDPVDGRPLDITKYKATSKPVNVFLQPGPFKCSTTLSHTVSPQLPDESRIMQVSPRGWDHKQSHIPIVNSPGNINKPVDSDIESGHGVDFTKSKTKTVKTYHYSGPSGVDLPGIGYIPRRHSSQSRSPSPSLSSSTSSSPLSSSSSSSQGMITRAIFVPGIARNNVNHNSTSYPPIKDDLVRFSVVESSDCDYNY